MTALDGEAVRGFAERFLVLMRGERIARNDVYFDRSVLASLLAAGAAQVQ